MANATQQFSEKFNQGVDKLCETVHQTAANEKAIMYLHSAVRSLETTRYFDQTRKELGCKTVGISDEFMDGVKEMAHLMEVYLSKPVPTKSHGSEEHWVTRVSGDDQLFARHIRQFVEKQHKNGTLVDTLLAAAYRTHLMEKPEPHLLHEEGGEHNITASAETLLSLIYPQGQEALIGKNKGPAR